MTTELRTEDFVAWGSAVVSGSLWVERETFGACVMNPPYRKVHGGTSERRAAVNAETARLLLPVGHYTLVKRFTAKEERRRVVATPFCPDDVDAEFVGFENHLNVFHREGRGIEVELAFGVAIYLNTSTVDAYVRQLSGHTQINAADLRLLRYPSRVDLEAIGRAVIGGRWPTDQAALDALAAVHVEALASTPEQRIAA